MEGWGPRRLAKSTFERRAMDTLRWAIKGCVSSRLWSKRCSMKPDLRRGKMMCSKWVPVEKECCLEGLPNGLERMAAACLDLLVLGWHACAVRVCGPVLVRHMGPWGARTACIGGKGKRGRAGLAVRDRLGGQAGLRFLMFVTVKLGPV